MARAQIVIENPILNRPFDAPERHFRFDDDGITDEVVEGRRPSSYFMPIPKAKKKGGQLVFDEWTGDRIKETKLISQIRERVGRWRDMGWPGVTPTTRSLLEYWTDPEREKKLFFCQVEALETAIYITECAKKQGDPWIENELRESADDAGRHLQVRLRSADIAPNEKALVDLECEVQIHTRAQNAWATVSHALLYKPVGEPDDEVSAKVHRAVALVGIFDDEIRAARGLVMSDPNYRPADVQALEAEFTDFVTVAWDGNLSLEVCRVLEQVYDAAELENFEAQIHAFVEAERGPIAAILDEYGGAGGDALLMSQPEILAIYDRLKKSKHALREAWIHSPLSLDLLIEAGRALGEPCPRACVTRVDRLSVLRRAVG